MKKSLDLLKPKANRLLEFVMNWQAAKPEKNVELSRALQKLMQDQSFPRPIRAFFRLPHFKRLLKTMENEGKLFILKRAQAEEDHTHPPLEIQNIQTLVETLHKLVHLDYNRQSVKDPVVQAKIYADNTSDYLHTVRMLAPFEGKIVEEILDYLFKMLRRFCERLKELVEKSPHSFSPTLGRLVQEAPFTAFIYADRQTYRDEMIVAWHPILTELNIEATLSHLEIRVKQVAKANAHKLLNQMKSLVNQIQQFYERHDPRFLPTKLQSHILEKFVQVEGKKEFFGHEVNEICAQEFLNSRYEVIEAKEMGLNHKFAFFSEKIQPLLKSFLSLCDQFEHYLPSYFHDYFQVRLRPHLHLLAILGKPNHLAIHFTSGIVSTQLDYLIDLLAQTTPPELQLELQLEIQQDVQRLLPTIHSFLESYYTHKPQASFYTIRTLLENAYSEEELWERHLLEDVKQRIQNLFSYLLPTESRAFPSLEAAMRKLLPLIQEIVKKLPQDTGEKILLCSILRDLEHLDLPSFSHSWYIFGSLLSSLYVLLSHNDQLWEKTLLFWQERTKNSPAFKVMFFY